MRTLRAALFDVGGTLLDDDSTLSDEDIAGRRSIRLRSAFGGDRSWFHDVVAYYARDRRTDLTYRQDTRTQIREYLATIGVTASADDAELVRSACCLPGPDFQHLRMGALGSLRFAKSIGLRVGLCTNVQFRTGADSSADWSARGAEGLIDAHVTSIDVGWLKPHPAMFETALDRLGATPDEAVMIGDSVPKDIAPAKRLGMRVVHVRSTDTGHDVDAGADATIAELTQLPGILAAWAQTFRSGPLR